MPGSPTFRGYSSPPVSAPHQTASGRHPSHAPSWRSPRRCPPAPPRTSRVHSQPLGPFPPGSSGPRSLAQSGSGRKRKPTWRPPGARPQLMGQLRWRRPYVSPARAATLAKARRTAGPGFLPGRWGAARGERAGSRLRSSGLSASPRAQRLRRGVPGLGAALPSLGSRCLQAGTNAQRGPHAAGMVREVGGGGGEKGEKPDRADTCFIGRERQSFKYVSFHLQEQ